MSVHEMACEHGMGYTWSPQDSPVQEPGDTAMALLGGVRGKRRVGERDPGDIFLEKLLS